MPAENNIVRSSNKELVVVAPNAAVPLMWEQSTPKVLPAFERMVGIGVLGAHAAVEDLKSDAPDLLEPLQAEPLFDGKMDKKVFIVRTALQRRGVTSLAQLRAATVLQNSVDLVRIAEAASAYTEAVPERTSTVRDASDAFDETKSARVTTRYVKFPSESRIRFGNEGTVSSAALLLEQDIIEGEEVEPVTALHVRTNIRGNNPDLFMNVMAYPIEDWQHAKFESGVALEKDFPVTLFTRSSDIRNFARVLHRAAAYQQHS